MSHAQQHLQQRLRDHIDLIYGTVEPQPDLAGLGARLLQAMRLEDIQESPPQHVNHWDQRDAVLITYGDSMLEGEEEPLHTLLRFLDEHCADVINSVHILPFFPYSSDDGFAVMDYDQVSEALGDWEDIRNISKRYRLMSDVVINHCSARSLWFENFLAGQEPGKDYFFTASPDDDLREVVRPRTNPLLRPVETEAGTRHVWCTFSEDQVDFDFRNPEVLLQFVRIMRLYLDQGIRIFRLDAIAFLWKVPGTNCLNLEQTHEIVRLLRTLVEHAQADAVIITETNIPNRENISYFGNGNEAHWVYNFSLPPLLVHALITGTSFYLKQWLMAMPPAQNGTTYFNFIASHDGIGLRPLENLLSEEEEMQMIETMQRFGGRISWRALDDGISKPYEVNIALYDALQGTTASGPDEWNQARFICAHCIMLALEGIPAFYVHSLLATGNDEKRVENTGQNRAINRHKWDYPGLQQLLADPDSRHHRVFSELCRLLKIRSAQPAFHPNATQFTLHLGDAVCGFWRQSADRRQSIFCISNVSDQPQLLARSSINLIDDQLWRDLISEVPIEADARAELKLAPYQTRWITNS